jgi:NMD protein affecting ribosome stability and mRNA decay
MSGRSVVKKRTILRSKAKGGNCIVCGSSGSTVSSTMGSVCVTCYVTVRKGSSGLTKQELKTARRECRKKGIVPERVNSHEGEVRGNDLFENNCLEGDVLNDDVEKP